MKDSDSFSSLLQLSPDAIIIVDEEGKIFQMNQRLLEMFEYERDELLGKPIELLIPDRFRSSHVQHRSNYAKHPTARPMGANLELFAKKKSGAEFPVTISLSPITFNNQKKVVAAVRDISTLKAQEKELRSLNSSLEQFVYISSHDLQEPINTYRELLRLLKEELKANDPSRIDDLIARMDVLGERMSEQVKELLQFAKIGRNKEFVGVECQQILDEALELLQAEIEKTKAEISVKSTLPKIFGLRTELRLLFQNLIDNAIKFQPEGQQPKIVIDAQKKDDTWHFTFQDNGIGINPQHFGRLFQVFQRLNNRQDFDGTGIGLAHCKKIIDVHKGYIWIESTEGKGATFHFTIPISLGTSNGKTTQ